LGTLIFFAAWHALSAAQPAHRLVVIAVDGLDARMVNDSSVHVKIPNIRKLIATGASASVMATAPSDTAATNLALFTGLHPAEYTAADATLWSAAEKDGLKVASVFLPIPPTTQIFNFPAPLSVPPGKAVQFDDVAAKSIPAGVVNRVEASFPRFQKDVWDDSSSSAAATYILSSSSPDLLLIHLTDVEFEQQGTGALGVYARDALENDDELIGQILAKAPKETIVALVSGHGVEYPNYIVRPKVLLKQLGQSGNVEVADGLIGTSDKAVAERLRKLMTDRRKHGIAREVPMAEVKALAPELSHWVAAFDTPQNYVASNDDHGPALGAGSHLTVAGLWPARPAYRSFFVISGEGIHTRKLREIDLLEVAPTLAEIIGVSLPKARTKSLWTAIAR
jgi:hypothetical protein